MARLSFEIQIGSDSFERCRFYHAAAVLTVNQRRGGWCGDWCVGEVVAFTEFLNPLTCLQRFVIRHRENNPEESGVGETLQQKAVMKSHSVASTKYLRVTYKIDDK